MTDAPEGSIEKIDAEARERGWVRDLGVKAENLFALGDALEADFQVESYGLRQLEDIPSEFDRAIVSDQIVAAASAAVDNLVECKLHDRALAKIAPRGEIKSPSSDDGFEEIELGKLIELNVVGFFRAAVSALDCVAACAVGVARIPTSVTKASYLDIANLKKRYGGKHSTDRLADAWDRIDSVVAKHRSSLPAGWYAWLIDIRNAQVHRPRQTNIYLPEEKDLGGKRLALLPGSDMIELARSTARYSIHLRRRPGLPDLQDLLSTSSDDQIWMSGPATDTMPLIFICLNEMIEELALALLDIWGLADANGEDFPAPVKKWNVSRAEPNTFNGTAPEGEKRPAELAIAHPHMAKRAEIANRLREHPQHTASGS